MRHHLLTGSLALVGLCFVTGCASGQAAPSAVAGSLPASSSRSLPSTAADSSLSGVHACGLVPASVVARVLGPLLERPYETQDGLKCFYNTATQGGGGPSYILTVATRSGFEAAKSFAEGVAQSGTGA